MLTHLLSGSDVFYTQEMYNHFTIRDICTLDWLQMEVILIRKFDAPILTNDLSIDRVLAAGLTVLFVFLDGSLPAGLDGALNDLAREYAGQMLIVKVPAKDNPNSRNRYGIVRIPTLVAVKDGQVLSRGEDIQPEDIKRHAAYLLGKGPKPQEAQPRRYGETSGTSRPSGSTAASGGATGPIHVTDATFDQEVLRSPLPVLIDFWAPWCGPCRMVEPIVEKLSREKSGRMKFVKMNVDENPAVSGRYGVQSIPTMMIVKDGQVAARWAGALPEQAIRSKIAPFE
jgi:thioredoxin